MNTFIKFLFWAIIIWWALNILALWFALIMIWWTWFAWSPIIAMSPFLIIGWLVGISTLD